MEIKEINLNILWGDSKLNSPHLKFKKFGGGECV
jgi:hypothetical protein